MNLSRNINSLANLKEIGKDINSELSLLNPENFEPNFGKIKEKQVNFNRTIDFLLESEQLSKNSKTVEEIFFTAKLISDKFDNIIEEWKNKVKNTEVDLSKTQNELKLLSYKRF